MDALSHSFIYLCIYPSDLQESDGSAIHKASNLPDLLSKMPKYYCPVEIFYVFFSFIKILLKFKTACQSHQAV